jgi:hypothetical protein
MLMIGSSGRSAPSAPPRGSPGTPRWRRARAAPCSSSPRRVANGLKKPFSPPAKERNEISLTGVTRRRPLALARPEDGERVRVRREALRRTRRRTGPRRRASRSGAGPTRPSTPRGARPPRAAVPGPSRNGAFRDPRGASARRRARRGSRRARAARSPPPRTDRGASRRSDRAACRPAARASSTRSPHERAAEETPAPTGPRVARRRALGARGRGRASCVCGVSSLRASRAGGA